MGNETGPKVCVILPVYNDRVALERAIPQTIGVLEKIAGSFEVIVAEDGSTDGSREFVEQLAVTDSRVRLLHSDQRQGRGRALTRAIQAAQAPVVCYYDVDLATDLKHLPELVDSIRRGFDIATGSRLMQGSGVRRSGGREFTSRGYNLLVRMVLGSTLLDHQCGFKAFNRDRLIPLLPRVHATHWFWDTEVLVRAQKAGYRVREFAVQWTEGKGTTVKPRD
ncbi:MAG: glycosyltransferase family 2 protein, partial [Methanomicrobiales archaeon]|nr:glycosyltransferase family 2 protein [Methanomicrobiales archaeon]